MGDKGWAMEYISVVQPFPHSYFVPKRSMNWPTSGYHRRYSLTEKDYVSRSDLTQIQSL